MKKFLGLLLFCFTVFAQDPTPTLGPTPEPTPEPELYAYWTPEDISFSSYHGRLCRPYYSGFEMIGRSIEAKKRRFSCSGNRGGLYHYESLQLDRPSDQAKPVRAEWVASQLVYQVNGNDCPYTARAAEEILDRVAVRNLQYSVYCNGDSGQLYFNFEALVPFGKKD